MTTTTERSTARGKARSTQPKQSVPLREHPTLKEIVGDSFMNAFDYAMKLMEWAEQEIESTSVAYPEHADRLWHSFKLLKPTAEMMGTEFVYRSHCRELLNRVVAGKDTRPGTAAECCIACSETSTIAPFNVAGTGLYMRMWVLADFPDVDFPREHYEAIKADAIDENEQLVRRKLACAWRQLPKVIEHSSGCPATKEAENAKAKAKR
jgi:hypothetical protein